MPLFERGGIMLGAEKVRGRWRIHWSDDESNTICLGSIGSGKTRRILLPGIVIQALAGESMVVSNPKEERYEYPHTFRHRCCKPLDKQRAYGLIPCPLTPVL